MEKVAAEDELMDPIKLKKETKLLLSENPRPSSPSKVKTNVAAETCESPPDGGWGWCVVLAGTVCMMMLGTQGPCFGVLYGQRVTDLGASPSLATWLFNIQSLIWNLSGPWAGPLSEVFSYRAIAVTGSLMSASSLFLSALVTNPYLLLLTFSTLVGVGGGLAIVSCYHMTARYFSKRLGLANGIVVTGGSMGLILLPQLASFLQENYSFQWASFITGAVFLHAPVFAMLLHPVSWHRHTPQLPCQGLHITAVPKSDKLLTEELPRGCSVPEGLLKFGGSLRHVGVDPKKRLRSGSECQPNALSPERHGSAYFLGGSSFMSGSVLTLQQDDITAVASAGDTKECTAEEDVGPLRRVWRKFRSQYNLRLMMDPIASGVALATCVSITGAINIFVATPFLLAEADYNLQDAATAMSVAAVADLLTRVFGATIADYPKVDIRFMYALGQLIYIVVPYVFMYNRQHWWVVLACMSLMGVGLGIMYVLDVLLLVRVLGAHRMVAVFGLTMFFRCLAFTAMGPVGGQLRELTGSFVGTVTFMTCTVLLGLLLMLLSCTTLATHCCRRSQHEKRTAAAADTLA